MSDAVTSAAQNTLEGQKMDAPRRYWLFKSEPSTFSLADLEKAPNQATAWDGVRNYQVRNAMRDQIQVGDGVLFYHSSTEPSGVAGLAEVIRGAEPDPSQFDPDSKYYDSASKPASPTWLLVTVQYRATFPHFVTLRELKATPGLEKMGVVQRGSRLSITPVTPEEWALVRRLGQQSD